MNKEERRAITPRVFNYISRAKRSIGLMNKGRKEFQKMLDSGFLESNSDVPSPARINLRKF